MIKNGDPTRERGEACPILGSINARDRGDPSTAVPDEGVYRISNWGEQKPIRIPSTFAQATVSVFVSRL